MTGLILLDKPSGKSSFGAVAAIKHLLGEKRVGHTGTLDPMATGVLPILIGRATALSSFLLDADKEYIATVKLGITTDTGDITGKVTSERKVAVTDDDIERALQHFLGEIEQTPPMYSALKKDGVRLYDLARKGVEVEIPKRNVTVYSIELLSKLDENNEFIIKCLVSKGTYIRSLCADIGEYLSCGATLSELRRTKTSGYDISRCVRLEDLSRENIGNFITGEEDVVKHFKEVKITENQAKRFLNGGQLDLDRVNAKNLADNEICRIKYRDKFLGLGYVQEQKGHIAIKCVIADSIY